MFTRQQLIDRGYVERDGEWIKERNPVVGLPDPKPKRVGRRGAEKKDRDETRRKKRPRVIILSLRVRAITDHDNLVGGAKHLRDAIAAEMGLDDADSEIEWIYTQAVVPKKRDEGTIVRITP
jgi:hypothetical protein